MYPLTLEEIARAVGGQLAGAADPRARVTGPVVIDSREVVPGGMFAAFAGEHADGHEFAAAAVGAGAVAVLAARPVAGPAVVVADVQAALGALARAVIARLGQATVIGLTGSSGKTSTKDLLFQVLDRYAPTVATERSFNNEIGLPLTVLRAQESTRFLVLEMGASAKGDISYLTGLVPPQIGVVLNVGSAHIEGFGSRAAIAEAKGEMVEALPAEGLAVLNADDDLVAAMRARTLARLIWFGRRATADVHASEVRVNDTGRARFRLHTPSGSAPVALELVGEHQVSNALAAAAVAHGLGMDVEAIASALTSARPLSAGRMEVTERRDGVIVINDAFNANPHSVRAALRTLTAMAARRTIAVLGGMNELGGESASAHEEVGRLAANLNVTRLVVVGLPGSDAARIASSARSAHPGLDATLVPDKDTARALLKDELRRGDVVLVKASHAVGLDELAESLIASED